MRQRTMLTNALRAHLAEYGIVSRPGCRRCYGDHRLLHEEQAALPSFGPDSPPRAGDSATRASKSDREDRGGNPRMASIQRGEPTAGDDPRHRPDHGERDSRECARRLVCSDPVASSRPGWD